MKIQCFYHFQTVTKVYKYRDHFVIIIINFANEIQALAVSVSALNSVCRF